MSGVYINGMEMPKNCEECPVCDYEQGECLVNPGSFVKWEQRLVRQSWCPLVPVPDHGRLIDADAMSEKDNDDFSAAIETAVGFATKQLMIMAHAQLQKAIEIQPTIIPADKEAGE